LFLSSRLYKVAPIAPIAGEDDYAAGFFVLKDISMTESRKLMSA